MGFSVVDQSPCGYLFCQSDSLCERNCGAAWGSQQDVVIDRKGNLRSEFQLLGLARWERPPACAWMRIQLLRISSPLNYLAFQNLYFFGGTLNGP